MSPASGSVILGDLQPYTYNSICGNLKQLGASYRPNTSDRYLYDYKYRSSTHYVPHSIFTILQSPLFLTLAGFKLSIHSFVHNSFLTLLST